MAAAAGGADERAGVSDALGHELGRARAPGEGGCGWAGWLARWGLAGLLRAGGPRSRAGLGCEAFSFSFFYFSFSFSIFVLCFTHVYMNQVACCTHGIMFHGEKVLVMIYVWDIGSMLI